MALIVRMAHATLVVLLIVVEPALSDVDYARFDAVDQAMLPGDTARPETGQRMLERLGFAEAGKRVTLDIGDQGFYTRYKGWIMLAPVSDILTRVF